MSTLLCILVTIAIADAASLHINITNVPGDDGPLVSDDTPLLDPSLLTPLRRSLPSTRSSTDDAASLHINITNVPGDDGPLVSDDTPLLDPSLLTPLRRSLPSTRSSTEQCGCGHSVANPATGRIVSGEEVAPRHKLPYQLYLQSCKKKGCFLCGATLLNKRYALTAMHCVDEAVIMKLAIGEHDIRKDIENHAAQSIKVERVIKREDYDVYKNNDIAILRLSEEVTFNENVVPACLPSDASQQYANWTATVSGWGRTTSQAGSSSDVLKETTLTVLPQDAVECSKGEIYSSPAVAPDTKMCAYMNGTDSCQGDSGGPLAVMEDGRWTVVGVVSYGVGCATEGYAGIYARVTTYLPWIQENIADGWCDSSPVTEAPARSGDVADGPTPK